jgi:hypothetical protein
VGTPQIKKSSDFQDPPRAQKASKYHFELLLKMKIGEAYFLPDANPKLVRSASYYWSKDKNVKVKVATGIEDGVTGAVVSRIK